jgi:hypothetical protein
MDKTMTKLVAIGIAVAAVTTRALAASPDLATARGRYVAGKIASSSDEKAAQHEAGVALARARLAAKADDPDGLLWLAANLGAGALAKGKLTALRVVPELERTLLRLDAVAPHHEHAAAARALGRLYHQAPAVISVGSSGKARVWFERALALEPTFAGNQALAADFFADQGERERAQKLARAALAGAAGETGPDAEEWREIAQHVLGMRR